MKCENCGNEHDGSYGSGRFCSDHCRRSFVAKQRHKSGALKTHLYNLHKQRQLKQHWECNVCGVKFDSRRLLMCHKRQEKHCVGGPGALKHKTKESLAIRKKISETMKNGYSSGRIIPPFKGKSLSASHKEKISEGRQKTLDTNLKCGKRVDVKWYKVKNLCGKEFIVRGHWEENVANKLTEKSILWTRGIRLKYFKSYWHTYTPDFYLPELNAYIEVKGYYPDEDKLKMELVMKYNPLAKIYFIGANQYKEFLELGELKKEYLLTGDSHKSSASGSEPLGGGALPPSPTK